MEKNLWHFLQINTTFLLLIVLVFLNPVYGSTDQLSQENGLYQFQPEKQYPLGAVSKIELNFDLVPLKKLKKARIHKGLIYLLDSEREKIYVIDKHGKYIRSIGQHGMGPGDQQSPNDFFISEDGMIYVLCGISKRVESYDRYGNRIKTIRLKNGPYDFSGPCALLFDGTTFYLGREFNHIVSTFDCRGHYINSILMRKKPLKFPGSHVVFEPQLEFTDNQKKIVIFDSFRGIFGVLDKTGRMAARFSFKSDKQNRVVSKFRTIKGRARSMAYKGAMVLALWTNFCMDEDGNLYTIPLVIAGAKTGPVLLSFSSSGRLLYKKQLNKKYFLGKAICGICSDREDLFVITMDFDLIKMKWRKGND